MHAHTGLTFLDVKFRFLSNCHLTLDVESYFPSFNGGMLL